MVALLALTQYGWNRVGPAGDFVLDPVVTFDSTFHVGVTQELVSGYPPQVPGAAGFPLGYHLGTDLVRAAALRWAGTDPWDSLTRLDVTLWALALILVIRGLLARLGAPPAAVALAPWTLLLTDFSFVFAANPQAHWWADLLRGNLLFSLVYANPIVPALALALGALVALSRHEESVRARPSRPGRGAGGGGPLLQGVSRRPPAPGPRSRLLARPRRPPAVARPDGRALRRWPPPPWPWARGARRSTWSWPPSTWSTSPAPPWSWRPWTAPPSPGGPLLWLAASLGLRVFGVGAALRRPPGRRGGLDPGGDGASAAGLSACSSGCPRPRCWRARPW